jgi:hypothetical protein
MESTNALFGHRLSRFIDFSLMRVKSTPVVSLRQRPRKAVERPKPPQKVRDGFSEKVPEF